MAQIPWIEHLRQHRVIAVIRAPSLTLALQMAQAAAKGGIRLIEITWNSAQPAETVTRLRDQIHQDWIGAGTLLSVADCQAAIAAGAQFCVSPHTDPAIMAWAQQQQIPTIPGSLTPNEILTAWQAGATAVKVFPIVTVGGANYIRNLQGPMAHVPLLPTGGVNLHNARPLIEAGAVAVGLSSSLFVKSDLAHQQWDAISRRCEALLNSLNA